MKTSNFKIFLSLAIVLIFSQSLTSSSQNTDIDEKVSSILSQMPAQNNEQLSSLLKEIIDLGQPGLNAIIKQIKPAGEGDDSKARFALGSMAFYLTKKPGSDWQKVYSNTITAALNIENMEEVNSFYMSLLQIAGTNEAVTVLAEYLNNKKLCDPAVRALVDIGTVDAKKALIKALNTGSVTIQTSLVEGLGYMRSQESAKRIRVLSDVNNTELKKVCLYALANIPDLKAENILTKEAENAGFTYNNTNATASLLIYLRRLGETGNTEASIELGNNIINQCNKDSNAHTKAAALAILKNNGNKKLSFIQLFNGKNLDNWKGNKTDYIVENETIVLYPDKGGKGNLYTEKEYSDFILRFEFQLTPGANNGLGIRTPLKGDAAYVGMELQILDNTAKVYENLEKYQYHGSVYGVIPAKRGFLKPVGEWNYQEVTAIGNKIKVILNGEVILEGDIKEAASNGTLDGKKHPGLFNPKGHIGFLGHGSPLKFRNIWIKDLSKVH
ncbi:MAG: DUF1080 domain-containing protein [Bacteroidales bacterium]|nr:DUF1080 domain-containing protein [Bacteroidales bacterium]